MSDDGQVMDQSSCGERVGDGSACGVPESRSIVFEEFTAKNSAVDTARGRRETDDSVPMRVEFAASAILSGDVADWQSGTLVPFDEPSSAAVRVYIGETLIARGELVEVDGEFAVEVVEMVVPTKKKAA